MNFMSNVTVIILTFNEEIHIERCIKSLKDLNARIIIVDSFSNDKTIDLAKSLNVNIYQNPFTNQAQQFQWAVDNCEVKSEWILRLDADETIDFELSTNIIKFINNNGFGHNGAVFNRKHIFLGKWIRFGGRYPLPMLRLFRNGTAHIEQKWMDEHIVLDSGTSLLLKGGFIDDNLNSIHWFIEKHNKYASREAIDVMLRKLNPQQDNTSISKNTGAAIRFKRMLKKQDLSQLALFCETSFVF